MGKLFVRRRKSKSPQVGDMRERILIQKRTMGTPDYGKASFKQGLSTIAEVWSSVETSNGDEIFDGVDTKGKTVYHFSIRYRTDITFKNIIGWNGENYKILPVEDPDIRKRFLFLHCVLLGDDGLEVNK
jgi:SPP1 family predicted phage head-tail adaptor